MTQNSKPYLFHGSLSSHYINPDLNLEEFDSNKPHTPEEWTSFFFSASDEARLVDSIPNPIVRTNLHQKAINTFLNKKKAKNLLTQMTD